ncbi:hypothetical protein [Mixta intestinalis]|uniref:Uncharacterized protein n=1 Tax=Mixta intestinalis TaxID=1615494 RepID=A0A6P1PYW2_9GAMM|nr:hypothetical protein [Mixta intestinalis]QHM71292.1 hypothetical protein C7M51_01578 [Mixta intestinalis]
MINIPGTPIIGGTNSGIWTPGAVLIGNSSAAGQVVDVIDLTSPALDSRVTFTGPAYRYFNATGALVECSENEWPLEYRNGSAIGRREPFAASSNAISALQAEYMTIGAPDGWLTQYTEKSGNTYHRLRFNTTATGPLTLQIFYKILGRENLCLRIATNTANNYRNIGINGGEITYAGDGITNTAITNCGDGVYLLRAAMNYVSGVLGLLTAEAVVTSDDLPRVATLDANAGFYVGYPQLTAGELAAPPLDLGESLPASSVVIDTSAALRITVRYSDGTTDSYDTPGVAFTLPAGERHIKRIELKQ